MIILGFISVMIFVLILLDYINVPIINESPLRNKLHLHWLFVIGSIFGQGRNPLIGTLEYFQILFDIAIF